MTTVNSDFYIGAHFTGFRAEMEHVLLLDMAIHTFDAARLISNADPVSVCCKDWEPKNSWFKNGSAAAAIFEMSEGIVYTYRGSWVAEGLPTTWACDWRIIGEKGTVKWDGAEKFEAQIPKEGKNLIRDYEDVPVPERDPGPYSDGHCGAIREFVNCVRSGGTPETVCTDNIKSLAMVFGAIESAELGMLVSIERSG